MSSVASPRLIYTRALIENVPSFSGDEKNKQRKKKKTVQRAVFTLVMMSGAVTTRKTKDPT